MRRDTSVHYRMGQRCHAGFGEPGIYCTIEFGESFLLVDVVLWLRPAQAGPSQVGREYQPFPPAATYETNDRLLPHLPPLLFSEREPLPERLLHESLDDIPCTIYRRQRLLRALGHLPPAPISTPSRSSPPPIPAAGADREGQFSLDIAVTHWNAQALFAADPARHEAKAKYVNKLIARSDVCLLSETHGTDAGNATWTTPPGTTAWWSAGASTGHAGVGILIKKSLLKHSSRVTRYVIWRGRALKLRLQGPHGTLDLIVVYFPTGAAVFEPDLFGVPEAHRARMRPSQPYARICAIAWLAGSRPRTRLSPSWEEISITSPPRTIAPPSPRCPIPAGVTEGRKIIFRLFCLVLTGFTNSIKENPRTLRPPLELVWTACT